MVRTILVLSLLNTLNMIIIPLILGWFKSLSFPWEFIFISLEYKLSYWQNGHILFDERIIKLIDFYICSLQIAIFADIFYLLSFQNVSAGLGKFSISFIIKIFIIINCVIFPFRLVLQYMSNISFLCYFYSRLFYINCFAFSRDKRFVISVFYGNEICTICREEFDFSNLQVKICFCH